MYQQLSEISPALSEILVDGRSIIQVRFRKKLQLQLVLYPFKLDRVGGYVLNCQILRKDERDTHLTLSFLNCF